MQNVSSAEAVKITVASTQSKSDRRTSYLGIMTIDGRKVEFTDEKNVLSVIRKAGINVPTLCYQPELSIYGACRLCTVEDERGKLFASCSEIPRDGMVIYTNTKRLKKYRKMIVELLLGAH